MNNFLKNKLPYTLAVMLGSLAILMLIGTAFGQEGEKGKVVHDATTYLNSFCFNGNIPQMSVKQIVEEYTKKTNGFFNKQVEKLMTTPQDPTPNVDLNEYGALGNGLCKGSDGKETNDMGCRSIAVCNANGQENTNPYCVGVTLLGFTSQNYSHYSAAVDNMEQLKYSYFCYKAALDQKRDEIYDSTPSSILAKCDSDSKYKDETVCKLRDEIANEKDASRKADLEQQMDMQLRKGGYWSTAATGPISSVTGSLVDFSDNTVNRVRFIDEETARAKTALDATLDAYSQLKTSWQMHVKYMDIFSELVKYRDHLVSIRKQTDAFPFRFIDATSTKCL